MRLSYVAIVISLASMAFSVGAYIKLQEYTSSKHTLETFTIYGYVNE